MMERCNIGNIRYLHLFLHLVYIWQSPWEIICISSALKLNKTGICISYLPKKLTYGIFWIKNKYLKKKHVTFFVSFSQKHEPLFWWNFYRLVLWYSSWKLEDWNKCTLTNTNVVETENTGWKYKSYMYVHVGVLLKVNVCQLAGMNANEFLQYGPWRMYWSCQNVVFTSVDKKNIFEKKNISPSVIGSLVT